MIPSKSENKSLESESFCVSATTRQPQIDKCYFEPSQKRYRWDMYGTIPSMHDRVFEGTREIWNAYLRFNARLIEWRNYGIISYIFFVYVRLPHSPFPRVLGLETHNICAMWKIATMEWKNVYFLSSFVNWKLLFLLFFLCSAKKRSVLFLIKGELLDYSRE